MQFFAIFLTIIFNFLLQIFLFVIKYNGSGGVILANIKSAKKRALTNEKRRLRNKMVVTNLKTTEKQFLAALAEGDVQKAEEGYKLASKKFDMAAAKGIIHKNAANRKKSKLAKKLNTIQA